MSTVAKNVHIKSLYELLTSKVISSKDFQIVDKGQDTKPQEKEEILTESDDDSTSIYYEEDEIIEMTDEDE